MDNLNLNNKNKPATIFVDCDDVLCDISTKWTKGILDQKDYFSKYFNLPNDINLVKTRMFFHLNQWLMKEDYKFESKEEFEEFRNKFMAIYLKKDFYSDLKPTGFAHSLSLIAPNSMVKKIIILTRSFDENFSSKKEFISILFRNSLSKVEIEKIGPDQKKSDIFSKYNECDILVDDELPNIVDILKNTFVSKCDIYVPKYGYNKPNDDFMSLVSEKKCNLTYYY